MKKTIIVFGLLIIALLVLFQISKFTIVSGNLNFEYIVAIIAILFLFIGIYLNKKSLSKTALPSSEINQNNIDKLEITKREYEVLQAISKGLSNKEIAEKLYLSESTSKNNIYTKVLDVWYFSMS